MIPRLIRSRTSVSMSLSSVRRPVKPHSPHTPQSEIRRIDEDELVCLHLLWRGPPHIQRHPYAQGGPGGPSPPRAGERPPAAPASSPRARSNSPSVPPPASHPSLPIQEGSGDPA